jgi:hypothetical protein
VVHDVEVDDTVEDLAADEAKWSVNSGQSTIEEGPARSFVVVAVGMSVVEVSDGD